MPRKQIPFSLDFITNNVSTIGVFKQFDDVSFNITPLEQGKPYNIANMTCKLFVGINEELFMQVKNITISDNKINILLDKNILQEKGYAYAELELTDSAGTITSSSFIFNINSKIGEGANIPGAVDDFITQYEKLIAKLKREVDSNLLENNNKIDTLIKDTNSKIDTYKSTKDTEINQNLQLYKSNTTEDIQTYKVNKDAEINQNLETFKNNTTTDIQLYKSTKDTEIDNYKTAKNTEIDNYKNEKNKELDISENKRVNDENIRIKNENSRITDENTRIGNENTRIAEHKKSITDTNNKIVEVEDRFQTLTVKQQQDAEVIESRDGEISLKARLERDLAKGKIINEIVEGNYISVKDSVGGYIDNVEILGNTIQDTVDLKNIKSVANLQEDGLYKMSILSCGNNLFDGEFETGWFLSNGSLNSGNAENSVRCKNYIKTKEGKQIIVSLNKSLMLSYNPFYVFYDKSFNVVGTRNSSYSFTVPQNVAYFKIALYFANVHNNNFSNINLQIEEGTQATTYEPYQCNKSSILLPCQLEKVGDVSDRLFRREDGVWCIEKNIDTEILNGVDFSFSKSSSDGTWFVGTATHTKSKANSPLIVSKIKSGNLSTEECLYKGTSGFAIRVLESTIGGNTSTILNSWLQTNNIVVKYQLATPQIIELPLDTQIQLNSFAGTTNIFTENTVIEPTIKCTIPKSLGASVQSLVNKTDNLSDRIEAVEKLKEGSELEVFTDKGYVVCENTNNGQIEELKIEGKTLVNEMSITGLDLTVYSTTIMYHTAPVGKFKFKDNTLYTLIILGTTSNFNGKVSIKNITNGQILTKDFITTFQTGTVDSSVSHQLHLYGTNFTDTDKANIKVVCLEGDHTQNPPSYFEGLKSVGDGVDKIEVLSCNNGNLVNSNMFSEKGLTWANGTEYTVAGKWITDFIEVFPRITLERDNKCILFLYDKNKNYLGNEVVGNKSNSVANENNYKIESDVKYIRVQIDNTSYKTMYLGLNKISKEIDYKQDKKQILIQNSDGVYEKPILRSTGSVSDTIEKHSDGKYYYHKRCGEIVLNGSENIIAQSADDATCLRFYIEAIIDKAYPRQLVVCNNIPSKLTYVGGIYGENIFISSTKRININILKSKLSSEDVAGFKTWLQSNNVTVVYELATEEVYECVNLDLDSYEGETSVIFNGGAISPKISFKIASHIANTISVLKDRINYLENKVIEMLKYALAGNVQSLAYELYPEDFENIITTEEENTETVEETELL